MHIGAIERIVSGRHRVAQESEQFVPELKLRVVVQPAHHANAEPLESEPRVDWATRAADAELILRDELRRRAEVDPQGVLPDGEGHVVGRRRCLFHFEVQRQVEDRVRYEDRVESPRLVVEGRVTGEVRVVVEKLNDSERNQEGSLRPTTTPDVHMYDLQSPTQLVSRSLLFNTTTHKIVRAHVCAPDSGE